MDAAQYIRFGAALVFVLALIAVTGWVVRRWGPAAAGIAARGRPRRLSIVEMLPIDAKRRLVLVRRDDVEHVILLGGDTDLVVEAGVPAPAPVAAPAAGQEGPSP